MSPPLLAHGGGGDIGSGSCYIDIGPYNMHLTGYQPFAHGDEKFCESFPDIGKSVLAFDFYQQELRKLNTTIRIVQVKSTTEGKSISAEKVSNSIAYLPPQKYPKGMVMVNHEFESPGYFVALVTLEDSTGKKYTGRFPFSVAMHGWHVEHSLLALLVVMNIIGYVLFRVLPNAKARSN
ncbi:MAG: hypothetical protein V3V31_03425 [Methylococcales bacterium]